MNRQLGGIDFHLLLRKLRSKRQGGLNLLGGIEMHGQLNRNVGGQNQIPRRNRELRIVHLVLHFIRKRLHIRTGPKQIRRPTSDGGVGLGHFRIRRSFGADALSQQTGGVHRLLKQILANLHFLLGGHQLPIRLLQFRQIFFEIQPEIQHAALLRVAGDRNAGRVGFTPEILQEGLRDLERQLIRPKRIGPEIGPGQAFGAGTAAEKLVGLAAHFELGAGGGILADAGLRLQILEENRILPGDGTDARVGG